MIRVNSLQVDSRLLPLSLQANAGEVWHVIGPNGCGKSTLLAALAGMTPFSGSVQIGGLDVSQASLSELARHRAYLAQNDKPSFQLHVFQYLALSVPANVALERSEVPAKSIRSAVYSILMTNYTVRFTSFLVVNGSVCV